MQTHQGSNRSRVRDKENARLGLRLECGLLRTMMTFASGQDGAKGCASSEYIARWCSKEGRKRLGRADSIGDEEGKESDAGVGRKKVTLTCGPSASASGRRTSRNRAQVGPSPARPKERGGEKESGPRAVRGGRGRALPGCGGK
jgi:hypothetical protein